ncbi:MAG: hypothetical protein H0W83_17140 [Planctomycetes bacterium]|nr:hypothetical protein [Planctomycetota bacterium]
MSGFQLTARVLDDDAGCILGPRHFVDILAAEPERPVLAGEIVDLRRSGWELDAALARGACSAAAWCARLAEDRPLAMEALRLRYEAFLAARGPCGLDPFHTMLIAVPPWQLVVSVIERLRRPRCASTTRRNGNGG